MRTQIFCGGRGRERESQEGKNSRQSKREEVADRCVERLGNSSPLGLPGSGTPAGF